MKCSHENCEVDTPLYRNNPKGQKGVWRCFSHLDPEYKLKHSENGTKKITEIIQKAND